MSQYHLNFPINNSGSFEWHEYLSKGYQFRRWPQSRDVYFVHKRKHPELVFSYCMAEASFIFHPFLEFSYKIAFEVHCIEIFFLESFLKFNKLFSSAYIKYFLNYHCQPLQTKTKFSHRVIRRLRWWKKKNHLFIVHFYLNLVIVTNNWLTTR